MSAGEIFIAGKVQDLGSDAMLTDIASEEIDSIREFRPLRYFSAQKFFEGSERGEEAFVTAPERPMRSIPFNSFSGISSYWNPKVQEDIAVKAGAK